MNSLKHLLIILPLIGFYSNALSGQNQPATDNSSRQWVNELAPHLSPTTYSVLLLDLQNEATSKVLERI